MTGSDFAPPTFGTDGLRGEAGKPPMDHETMQRVGAALGIAIVDRLLSSGASTEEAPPNNSTSFPRSLRRCSSGQQRGSITDS